MECRRQTRMLEYQLRKAAGKYWLLHMEQKGVPYERPLQLNAIAAEMWTMLEVGKNENQIVDCLVNKYNLSEEEIRTDFRQFCKQLGNYGILVEE